MAEGSRHATITPDDHGALLAMTTWFLACTLILCTATRMAVRLSTRQQPTIDDVLILFSAAFAVGSTIAISLAVSSGLGKRTFLLINSNVAAIQKEMYAATILYVLTVGTSKISITTFLARLACNSFHKAAVVFLGVVALCWTLAITGGVVFECQLPRPWEAFTGKCISMMPFWLAASIVDIVTDSVMIVLPIHIVSGLQLEPRKKAIVMFIFTLRIALIIVSTLRLVFLHRAITADLSFDGIPYGIATQCHSTLSVIVACSPALKPFMDNVRTGMLSASLAKHTPGTTFGKDSYNMKVFTKTSGQRSTGSRSRSRSEHAGAVEEHTSSARRSGRGYVYLQDEHGHIVAQPSPTPPPPSEPPFAPAAHAPVDLADRSSRTRSPPRPPPPPDELRPDISMFTPGIGSTSTAFRSESAQSEGWEKDSNQSIGSGRGIIKATRQWDVKFDDYHAH